jgi:hypothetical protein
VYASTTVISIIKVKKDEMGRACSMHEVTPNAYGILVGKSEGKTTRKILT